MKRVLPILYGLAGLAGTLALLRFGLRLLAADELSPIGSWFITAGGWLAVPFGGLFRPGLTAQLPGAVFDPAALLASLVYPGLAVLLAGAVASYQVWSARLFASPEEVNSAKAR